MSRKKDMLDLADKLEWGRPYPCRELAAMYVRDKGVRFNNAVGFIEDMKLAGYLVVAGSGLLRVNEEQLLADLLTYKDPGQQKFIDSI